MPYDHDDLKLGVLDVSLASGDLYRYYDVPENVYLAFIGAKSIGATFSNLIRNVFPCSHVKRGTQRKAS